MDANETRILISEKGINFLLGTLPNEFPFSKDKFTLEFSIARIFHRVLNVYRLINNQIFEHNDYIILGDSLSKILFENEVTEESRNAIETLMQRFRTVFRDKDKSVRCRIYLQFQPEAGDAAMLPWEYLRLMLETYDGETQTIKKDAVYLAADKDSKFDLIRSFPIYKNFNPPKVVTKLNVVIVTSECLGPYNIDEESKLLDWCNKIKKDVIEFHPLKQPCYTYDENTKQNIFTSRLKQIVNSFEGPYILHYFGHARTEQNVGQISFVGDDKNAVWIDDVNFSSLFDSEIVRKPHLVILQACSSGQITGINKNFENSRGAKIKSEFSGVAVSLVYNEIPAVVAMQNDVTEEASLEFLGKFYESLIDGDDIAEAVTKGRTYLAYEYNSNKGKQIEKQKDHSSNVFGTPVLFLSVPQPFRFRKKAGEKPETANQKYKYCVQCNEGFENLPGNRHEKHKTIVMNEDDYNKEVKEKEDALKNKSESLSSVSAVNREKDSINEFKGNEATSANNVELLPPVSADNLEKPEALQSAPQKALR